MIDWTSGLNPEQREAVLHTEGPLLILAGAGSGKTTVLVSRTGNILQSTRTKAEEICVLTFTNKAARELKHRVGVKMGPSAQGIWTGTFHSFCLRMLRKYHKQAGLPSGFGVIDQGDSTEILKELASNIRNSGKDSFKIDKVLSIMNDWRGRGRKTAQNEADEYEIMAQVLLPALLDPGVAEPARHSARSPDRSLGAEGPMRGTPGTVTGKPRRNERRREI